MSYNYKISSIFAILGAVAVVSALVNPVCLHGILAISTSFALIHLDRIYKGFMDKCHEDCAQFSSEEDQ